MLGAPALSVAALPTQIHNRNVKCQKSLGKGVRKLASTVVRATAKCHSQRQAGHIPAATDCNDLAQLDSRASSKIATAKKKLAALAMAKCNPARVSAPNVLGYLGCPTPCDTIAVTDYSRVGDCLACVISEQSRLASVAAFGSPAAPASDLAAMRCFSGVSRALRGSMDTRIREQQACQVDKLRGLDPAASSDCLTADLRQKIQTAEQKAVAAAGRCASDAYAAELASCSATVSGLQDCVVQAAATHAGAAFDAVFPPLPLIANPADLVVRGGLIYTVDQANPAAEAVAIRAGKFVYVGSNAGVDAWYGPNTRTIELRGKLALPGMHDVHQHSVEAMNPAAQTCELVPDTNPEFLIPILRNCAPAQTGSNWVLGFGYSIGSMLATGRDPVDILDDAIPGRPAAMLEETSHSAWVNSAALAALGISAGSPDPIGGIIGKNASGQPNGLLFENAGELAFEAALQPTPQLDNLKYNGLLDAMALLARNGITSVVDARVYRTRNDIAVYRRALAEGTLGVRTILALWAYPHFDDATQIADLVALYDNDPSSLLRISQVKLYSDGLLQNGTAALLAPYDQDLGITGPTGMNYFSETRLADYTTQLERAGFDIFIHAIGDRAVREALNAIESAMAANGPMDRRHRLTHVELVDSADRSRFAQLGVVADFQLAGYFTLPASWSYEVPLLGNRAFEQMPVRSIYDSAARMTLSSDYDVSEISPFLGMEHSLKRAQHSLPGIEAAIRAYTLDAAYVMRQEERTGSIEVGKLADLIVVNKNILDIPTNKISSTKVLLTLLGGTEQYRAPGF